MENNYFKKSAFNQSGLKDWGLISPREWYDKHILKIRPKKISENMDFGSLLDCLCYTPEYFEKNFIVSDAENPSEKIQLIVSLIYDHITELRNNTKVLNEENKKGDGIFTEIPLKEYALEEELVHKFAKENEYYVSQPSRAFNEITKNGTSYFEFLVVSQGKTVITTQQEKDAKELKEILFTNPNSKYFFRQSKGSELIFQQQIMADYEISGIETIQSLPVKGMLDCIKFNHNKKTVREVDLKFTEDAFLFPDASKRMNYAFQHSFYDFLLRIFLQTYKKGKYKDYNVAPPLNVVIDNKYKTPYIYTYNVNDLEIERKGIEGQDWKKGWENILQEIAFHLDKQVWDYPIEHIKNGFIAINKYKK